jgi:23S rRNA (cytidine1920-2'-O)/16S rRNA (cytidine1409-2'-O)-methyltransferase
MDVSFISIAKVLPACKTCLTENADMICLIKPQFEAGREQVEKGGIVRSAQVHIETIENLEKALAEEGIFLNALDYSPVKGATGNIEFLGLFSLQQNNDDTKIKNLIDEAHSNLAT